MYLFKEHGIKCLGLLNGDFAFAIYDKIENELCVVRDRFGIKPLYYTFDNKEIYLLKQIPNILLNPFNSNKWSRF